MPGRKPTGETKTFLPRGWGERVQRNRRNNELLCGREKGGSAPDHMQHLGRGTRKHDHVEKEGEETQNNTRLGSGNKNGISGTTGIRNLCRKMCKGTPDGDIAEKGEDVGMGKSSALKDRKRTAPTIYEI